MLYYLGRIEEIWEMCRDDFYPQSYDAIRETFPRKDINVIIQQALRNSTDFHGYMEDKIGVNLDNHIYQAFGQYWNELADRNDKGWEEHLRVACDYQEEVRSGFSIFSHSYTLFLYYPFLFLTTLA